MNVATERDAGLRVPAREVCAQATAADEAELRGLLRGTPMAGAVRLSFTREPDYFAGENLLGGEDRTILVRRAGRLACMGRCSRRTLGWNGKLLRTGYLGELRLAAESDGAMRMLREGYRFFREIEAENPAELYFTSIAADNRRGRRVLEMGRRLGLPEYRWIGDLVTAVVPVPRRRRRDDVGAGGNCAELATVLARHSRASQLGLSWDDGVWQNLDRHGVTERDFAVVRRAGEIVAAGAVWDQRAFRQTVVHGYGLAARWTRPWVNAFAALRGRSGWPRAGETVAQAPVIGLAWDDAAALRELWPLLEGRAAAAGVSWLVATGDATDARWAEARRIFGGREYRTRLYAVRWRDFPARDFVSDGRPFRPEVALL